MSYSSALVNEGSEGDSILLEYKLILEIMTLCDTFQFP